MHRIRIGSAGQRLCRFTELRVNPTETLIIQKNTRSIGLMIKPKIPAVRYDQRLIHSDAVGGCPFLFVDALLFICGNDDLVLPAAATAIVTALVLQNRQNDARSSHI